MFQITSPTRPRLFAKLSPIAIVMLTAAFALLWKLGAGSLAAWDEAIYAEVSKEILQTGDWLTLHWQYSPWFEKPPLYMWTTALFFRVFGLSEFSARLPSAISGLALIGTTYLIGKSVYNKRVGLLAAAILLTGYHFLSFARFGTMEVMLALFTYAAVYGYFRTKDDRRWWYLVGLACGLALMVKGAGGIIAPAPIVLALIFDRRLAAAIQSRHFWQACFLALLLVLPWHALMYARYGREFLNEYLGYHVIARVTGTLEGHRSSYLYYFGKLIDGFFPMILLLPFAIVSGIRNRKNAKSASGILPALAGFVFLLYTMVPTRRPWYIVPLYPALAIILASFFERLRKRYELRPVYRRAIKIVIAAFLVVGGFYSFASLSLNRKPADPVATLSRLAQSNGPTDRATLILFTNAEPYYAQVPFFYSNRPVLQAYESVAPVSHDSKRYVSFVRLGDVVDNLEKHIIFHKDDTQSLARKYEIRTIAEADGLVYGMIKRRQ